MIKVEFIRVPTTSRRHEWDAKRKFEISRNIKLIRNTQKIGEPDYYYMYNAKKIYVEIKHQGDGLSLKQILWILNNQPEFYVLVYSYAHRQGKKYDRRPAKVPVELWNKWKKDAEVLQ